MTLHLKSRGYPFRPRLLFSCFIVVGVGFPNCVLFQERTKSEPPYPLLPYLLSSKNASALETGCSQQVEKEEEDASFISVAPSSY